MHPCKPKTNIHHPLDFGLKEGITVLCSELFHTLNLSLSIKDFLNIFFWYINVLTMVLFCDVTFLKKNVPHRHTSRTTPLDASRHIWTAYFPSDLTKEFAQK